MVPQSRKCRKERKEETKERKRERQEEGNHLFGHHEKDHVTLEKQLTRFQVWVRWG